MNRIFCFCLLIMSVSLAGGAERPNIVFLLADDQALDTLGCYGNPDVTTPNIDGLAADGIVFENHYDTTAICMASRANIMTGMFEYKTGCNFEHGALLKEHWVKSYPMLLREAGYMTAIAGKFGFVVADAPGKKGVLPEGDFDAWGGAPGQSNYATAKNKSMTKYAAEFPHSTRSYGAFGRDFVKVATKANRPFCLSISFKAPHQPVTPDPLDDAVYAGKKFRKPDNYGREHGEHFSKQSKSGRQWERFESWGYADDFDAVMGKYHQQIYAIDVAVGMVREALKENGVAENTVIIYTSDNGFLCGSHGYGSKVLPYEEASRVPLIVFDPRHSNSGKKLRSEALTGNVDFAPTILELAGVEVPENVDGKSLVGLYEDPKAAIHESLPLINVWGPRAAQSFGVVTKDFKYVFWNYGGEGFEPTEEMFHLARDPGELRNAAVNPEYREQLEKMRAVYDSALGDWKANAVPYHGYEEYGALFDRTIPWPKKAGEKRKRKK